MNKRKRWKFNSFLVSVQILEVGKIGRAVGTPILVLQNSVIEGKNPLVSWKGYLTYLDLF